MPISFLVGVPHCRLHVELIVNQLRQRGFQEEEVSALIPATTLGNHGLALEATSEIMARGPLGWLARREAFRPEQGGVPFVACGALVSVIGTGIGAALATKGALAAAIPRYERAVREGCPLLYVSARNTAFEDLALRVTADAEVLDLLLFRTRPSPDLSLVERERHMPAFPFSKGLAIAARP